MWGCYVKIEGSIIYRIPWFVELLYSFTFCSLKIHQDRIQIKLERECMPVWVNKISDREYFSYWICFIESLFPIVLWSVSMFCSTHGWTEWSRLIETEFTALRRSTASGPWNWTHCRHVDAIFSDLMYHSKQRPTNTHLKMATIFKY